MFYYWEKAPEAPSLSNETSWLRRYLEKALKRSWTRAEARQIVELCGPGQFGDQARAYVKRVLRDDPRDPLFQLFHYTLHENWEPDLADAQRKLEPILTEARHRGDQEALQRAQQLLQNLKEHAARPISPMDPWVEDEEEEEEEDYEDVPPDLRGQFPGLSPEVLEEMNQVLELLAHASESEIRRMRKHPPKGVPIAIFDMMVDFAKSRSPLPLEVFPLPPPTGPKPKAAVPRALPDERDSKQLDLF